MMRLFDHKYRWTGLFSKVKVCMYIYLDVYYKKEAYARAVPSQCLVVSNSVVFKLFSMMAHEETTIIFEAPAL